MASGLTKRLLVGGGVRNQRPIDTHRLIAWHWYDPTPRNPLLIHTHPHPSSSTELYGALMRAVHSLDAHLSVVFVSRPASASSAAASQQQLTRKKETVPSAVRLWQQLFDVPLVTLTSPQQVRCAVCVCAVCVLCVCVCMCPPLNRFVHFALFLHRMTARAGSFR
jgi:hypothetical protein